ncbi:hypothetical protein [Streptococcus pluranimalium]|uniref:Lipoprotein BUG3 n=1 Tax=Streptococcus pluranimalium TaxID=82348 RepID=A0A2L0D2U1_9STRE|nr:hypothetical protein [Streptococcus pluranimalium]AUW96126.1 hypothetical protein C0J00_02785 [Streptococcus pluranimalium]
MKKITKWIVLMVCLGLILGAYQMLHSSKKESAVTNNSEIKQDKLTTRDKQLAYLKEHEQEIIDFVKSQNDKIESVQIDWDETQWDEASNGTPQGGGKIIDIYGKFNKIENSGWHIMVEIHDNMIDLDTMSLINYLSIEGKEFE